MDLNVTYIFVNYFKLSIFLFFSIDLNIYCYSGLFLIV